MGIVARHLSKSFDYYKKELGLKNSIRNLFHREKLVKEHSDISATLEVPRLQLKARSKAILDQLPVMDFTIADIPVEEGIALLFQRREAIDVAG